MEWIDLAQDRGQWRDIFERMRDWRLVNKGSAPWSCLVSLSVYFT
jgi:hypothetical protein